MSLPAYSVRTPYEIYTELVNGEGGQGLHEALAQMLASWVCGEGGMPRWLGLNERQFDEMLESCFPHIDKNLFISDESLVAEERFDEVQDLLFLLEKNQTPALKDGTSSFMPKIVVAGCMGGNHLWQDLGLWQRSELSKLMNLYFKPLAMKNVKDMKWKKFLYKQLCETEGIYTCRSPSCEVCDDYKECFGPEE